jgi:hypothetical protein
VAPPPDKDTVQAAYEALDDDARLWAGVSSVLSQAEAQAKTLGLGGFEMGYLAVQADVGRQYDAVQQLLMTMLHQGAQSTLDLSNTLIRVREDYERTDAASAARTHKAAGN